MKHNISFIKGKNLWTKSIEDLVVTWYFEISTQLYEEIHKHTNEIITLEIEYNWVVLEFDSNINTDTKSWITYCDWHWVLRLDVILHKKEFLCFIPFGNISLILKKWEQI